MNRRALIGPAFVLGVALALALGFLLGRTQRAAPPPPAPVASAAMRQVFSPTVLGDPYFRQQQRKNADVLEKACRETRQFCVEAAAARRWSRPRDELRPRAGGGG